MGYLKSIGTAVIYIGLFLAVITFVPGFPPDTEFREYSIVQPRDIDPKLGPKNRLINVERLFEGKFVGPEAYAAYDGKIYTSIHDGYVLRIEEDKLMPIAKFGKKCDGIWQEHKCGRPLGLRFDKKGNLYAVDAYYGIFKVNVETGDYKNIVNTSKPIDGKIPLIANSVDITENGDLYWTTSSSDFPLYDGLLTFLTNPSGRLIRYNAAKKKNEVLLQNLAFANGLILSNDESFVLVVEALACRITKYHLKGSKAGQKEIFVDGLPGISDNIQSDGQGGFLVTTVITIDSEHPHLTLSLIPHPYLRKMFVRLALLMELPFKLLNDIYPNTFAEKVMYAIGSFPLGEMFSSLKKSLVLRIDASGNIIEILSSDDNSICGMSEAFIHNGFIWFGSPWRNYIARVPLKHAFPDLANNEKQSSSTKENAAASNVKSEKAKRETISAPTSTTSKPAPTPTTTPKPTSTTSKPTTAPKPSPTPKVDKPTTTDSSNAKPSKIKSTSQSTSDAKVKKDSAEIISDAKPNTKSNSPNAKSETDNKKEDAAKINDKSEKSVKVEQDASVKEKVQKSPPKKVETVEARDDL